MWIPRHDADCCSQPLYRQLSYLSATTGITLVHKQSSRAVHSQLEMGRAFFPE